MHLFSFVKKTQMASGFFALFDDIAALLDDVAVMSKIAAKKTAGVLGDDLAVNAEKASGFASSRELPVLWAITKGSLLNKLIILPIAFVLSSFAPQVVIWILIAGGVYLAFEGVEKIVHYFFHKKSNHQSNLQINYTEEEILTLEKKKIKSAILTDFILSVEIVIIALGTVIEKGIYTQIFVVSIIAIAATVGVYGLVALIVRMDEAGLRLINISGDKKGILFHIGNFLVSALPKIVNMLSIIGTIALLLVSGGIFNHHINWFHHHFEVIPSLLRDMLAGLAIGFIALLFVMTFKWIFSIIKSKK